MKTAYAPTFAVLLSLWPALPCFAEGRTYLGFCEASAAVRLDATHVAVGSDDFKSILIFERGNPQAVGSYPVGSVTDIEAAARIGDTVIWATSHSLNSSGEDKPKRKAVFATTVTGVATLTAAGGTYRALRDDMATALAKAEAKRAAALGKTEDEQAAVFAKTKAGLPARFNIEGVADTPDGHLFIGLRGPRQDPEGLAILAEVSNPLGLVGLAQDGTEPPAILRVQPLDLSDGPGHEGRGVRDMARVGARYLILAGAEPDGGIPLPKLFWWDGVDQAGLTPGPNVDFTGMSPEAIVVWDDQSAEIYSDDGGKTVGGVECSDKSPPPGAGFSAVDVTF